MSLYQQSINLLERQGTPKVAVWDARAASISAVMAMSTRRPQSKMAAERWLGSWWCTHPSEKYEFVNWDDEIPHLWKTKIHVPVTTNQCVFPFLIVS